MARSTLIEFEFAAWLAAVPIVAADAGARVYPFAKVKQNSPKPYLTYFRIDDARWFTLMGPTTRVMETVIQVGVWGGYMQVKQIADALRMAIDNDLPQTSLVKVTNSLDSVRIQSARVIRTQDDFDPPRQGDELPEMRVELDVKLVFEEG